MIKNYTGKNKGKLKAFSQGDTSKVPTNEIDNIEVILTALDSATCIDDFDLPGKRLHAYPKTKPKVWSLDTSKNFRILFEFDGVNVNNVRYEDPH